MSNIQYQDRETTDKGAKKLLKTLISKKIVLVHVDTGGGKTFMSIRAIGVYDKNAHIIVLTTASQVKSQDWEKSIESYNHVKHTNLTYTVTSYQGLTGTKKQKEFLKSLKQYKQKNMYIIVDEAHRIKNPRTKNWKNVKKINSLPMVKGLILLTATPVTESPLEPAGYLILAGYYKNITDFNKQHVLAYDKYFQPIVKNYKGEIDLTKINNLDLLVKRFKSIRVNVKTDHLKPKTVFKELTFKYSDKIQKQYRQIAKNYKNGVYESIAEANAEQRKFISTHDLERKKVLSKIITSPKRIPGPILIFYKFNSQLESLIPYLQQKHPDYEIHMINGKEKVDLNNKLNKKSLILCQYVASGEALNASFSHCSVFFEPTFSWKEYKQALGRNTRAYQKGTTYHFRFVVEKTINEHYWRDLIDNKKKFTTELQKQYLNNND